MSETSSDITNKISSSKFVKFCRQNFSKDMASLESTRKYYILAIAVVILITVIVFCLYILYHISVSENMFAPPPEFAANFDLLPPEMKMAYMSYNNMKYVPVLFSVIKGLAALAIPGGMIYVIIKIYKNKAKDIILEKLLSYIGNFHRVNDYGAECQHKEYIQRLNLFNKFNSYSCDDRIQGKYNSLDIDISEIELSYITKTKSSVRTGSSKRTAEHTSTKTIFKGIVIKVPSYKKYQGFTIIKKNFDSISNKNNYSNVEKVNLEDPEFEKLYDVYSTDQIEARYLLTTAFINRMVELAKKEIGKNITVSFEQGNVNIAVASEKDWFEIPIIRKVQVEDFRAIIAELAALLAIIDSLKLEQNIGM